MKVLLCLILVLTQIFSLTLNFDSREKYCFGVDMVPNEEVKVVMTVSGQSQQENIFEVYRNNDLSLKPIVTFKGRNENTYKLKADNKPLIQMVCFQNLDGKRKIVDFDFVRTVDDLGLAKADNLKDSLADLNGISETLNSIQRDQVIQTNKETTHAEVLNSTETRVRWCSAIKLLVIMGICAIQILTLKGYFKNRSTSEFTV